MLLIVAHCVQCKVLKDGGRCFDLCHTVYDRVRDMIKHDERFSKYSGQKEYGKDVRPALHHIQTVCCCLSLVAISVVVASVDHDPHSRQRSILIFVHAAQ